MSRPLTEQLRDLCDESDALYALTAAILRRIETFKKQGNDRGKDTVEGRILLGYADSLRLDLERYGAYRT